jgi:hypothetical protein
LYRLCLSSALERTCVISKAARALQFLNGTSIITITATATTTTSSFAAAAAAGTPNVLSINPEFSTKPVAELAPDLNPFPSPQSSFLLPSHHIDSDLKMRFTHQYSVLIFIASQNKGAQPFSTS